MGKNIDIQSLTEACKYVDLFTFCNWAKQTVYFIYQDKRTLTINQEITIRNLVKEHLPDYEVVFGKVKKEEEQ